MTVAVILGGAKDVWAELSALKSMREPDVCIAVNDAGTTYPHRLDYWVTLHLEKLGSWIQRRITNHYPDPYSIYTHRELTHRERNNLFYTPSLFRYNTGDLGGGSGLFACKLAIELGFEKIVLCGIPMTREGAHFFDERPWKDAEKYRSAWLKHASTLDNQVKSMSGWTMELLGKPTLEWLKRKERIPDEAQD